VRRLYMTSSRISLAAVVAVALIACGGGGQGDGSGNPTAGLPGAQQPEYNDQAPPRNDDAPVDSYDPPPTSGEQPGPNPGGGPGGGGALCSRLCTELSARQCDVGDPNTCAANCSAELDESLGACVNEFGALFDCLLASPSFVCTDGELEVDENEDFAECEAPARAYAECADLEPEPEPQPGGECTPDDECVSCVDVCDYCLCLTDNDSVACETTCQ
jgi:hypothetical protein